MVPNVVSPGKGFRGVISYLTEDRQHEMIAGTIGEHDPQRIWRELGATRDLRPTTENPVFHCSISIHPDESLTDEQWAEVCDKFMERMGYGESRWTAIRHHDTDHDHLHLVGSRIDDRGGRVRDFKEWTRSQEIARELEIEYGLRRLGLEKNPSAERRLGPAVRGASKKDLIREQLKAASAEASTVSQYLENLHAAGVDVKAKVASTGRVAGLQYRLDGETWKASDLGRQYTLRGLQNHLDLSYSPERDDAILRAASSQWEGSQLKARLDAAIEVQLAQPGPSSLSRLADALGERGVSVRVEADSLKLDAEEGSVHVPLEELSQRGLASAPEELRTFEAEAPESPQEGRIRSLLEELAVLNRSGKSELGKIEDRLFKLAEAVYGEPEPGMVETLSEEDKATQQKAARESTSTVRLFESLRKVMDDKNPGRALSRFDALLAKPAAAELPPETLEKLTEMRVYLVESYRASPEHADRRDALYFTGLIEAIHQDPRARVRHARLQRIVERAESRRGLNVIAPEILEPLRAHRDQAKAQYHAEIADRMVRRLDELRAEPPHRKERALLSMAQEAEKRDLPPELRQALQKVYENAAAKAPYYRAAEQSRRVLTTIRNPVGALQRTVSSSVHQALGAGLAAGAVLTIAKTAGKAFEAAIKKATPEATRFARMITSPGPASVLRAVSPEAKAAIQTIQAALKPAAAVSQVTRSIQRGSGMDR